MRFELALTLICAEDDEIALLQVIESLKERGIRPEVVPGVDREPMLLGRAVDNGKPGLFLLCRSKRIDDSALRRLEGLFSARGGPGQELYAVEVDGVDRTVDAILERVAAFSGQDLTTGEHEPELEQSGENYRDVIEIRSVGDITAPGATRSKTPAPPEDDRRRRAEETTERDGRRRASSAEAKPQRSRPPTEKREPKPRKKRAASKPARAASKPARVNTEREPEGTKLEPKVPVAAEEKEGREPRWLVPVVAVAALTFGGLLFYRFVIAPGKNAAPPERVAAPQDSGEPPTDSGGDEGSKMREAGEAAGAGESGPGQATESTAGGETETGRAEDDAPGEEDQDAKDAEVERKLIEDAIAAKKMRALDLMIVLPKGPELAWRDAVDYCTMRRVGGVSGFRLPSSKELRSIRKARMLRTGDLYWSGTLDKQAGNGSDHVLALNKKNRMVPTPKEEPNGRPVCVRER